MAWVPIMGGITVFSVYFDHTEEWTERNQQILEATSREIRRCLGLQILAGDFNMEPLCGPSRSGMPDSGGARA